jgi:hypothetical protein
MEKSNFQKVLSSFIIAILFIPLVFMGSNVFFPKYDWKDYGNFKDCYASIPPKESPEQNEELRREQQDCYREQEENRQAWEAEKRVYDSWKYVFIVSLCLIGLLAALIPSLAKNIKFGLFIGAAVSAFASTMIYFNTKSKLGFILLAVLFILSVFFINKERKE